MPVSIKGEHRTRLDGCELEIFKLVQKRATFEQWREWLRVPLEHAAADGNMDLFTRLMDAGANGSAGWRGCHGRTLLGAAAAGKSEDMVIALLRVGAKDDVNVMFGEHQESALHVAATHGAEGASRALMFAGADPNLLDGEQETPLHLAAREGHDGVVSDLLVKRADPNATTLRNRETPLHLAAEEGWVRCVTQLLLGGADKNSRNVDGETPLYLAAHDNHHVGVVEELLAAKADLDIRADDGSSPLDVAANCDSLDVLRVFLRHGGDVKACNDDGYTALHHAADVDGPDHDNGGSVRMLLEAGADIEAKTTGGNYHTPLHVAACRRTASRGTMEALLEGGTDVNAWDIEEATPLHLACYYSNVGGVELLLRWGVDETLADKYGNTAADCVGGWEQNDDEEEREAEERRVDDQRIRHMLARAPADRAWRRRGWLVLARSRPAKVQLVANNRGGGGSAKVAKARCDGLSVGEGGDGEQTMGELGSLVRRVVSLDAEGVFRLVISFL